MKKTVLNIFTLRLNENRIYGLDILRALAILFVMLGHSQLLVTPNAAKFLHNFVLDGVSIFFVLSGFLIGQILIKTITKEAFDLKKLKNFWIRRWFRTLPNYFLVLTLLLLLHTVFLPSFKTSQFWNYYFFAQNIFTKHPTFFPEAWSLSIEEWFYLLIPVLLFLWINAFKLKPRLSVLLTAICLLLACTLFRYHRFSTMEITSLVEWDRVFRKQVFTRLDSIMFGVIGAYAFVFHRNLWLRYKLQSFLLGIVLLILAKYLLVQSITLGLYRCVFSFSVTSIGTLLLLPLLSQIKSGKGFVFKGFTYISLISYSMYLINLTLIQSWVLNNLNWDWLMAYSKPLAMAIKLFAYWGGTIALSILLFKYYELPFTKLRERFSAG